MSISNSLFPAKEVNGVRRFRNEDVRLSTKAFENDVSGRVLGDCVPLVVVSEIG